MSIRISYEADKHDGLAQIRAEVFIYFGMQRFLSHVYMNVIQTLEIYFPLHHISCKLANFIESSIRFSALCKVSSKSQARCQKAHGNANE